MQLCSSSTSILRLNLSTYAAGVSLEPLENGVIPGLPDNDTFGQINPNVAVVENVSPVLPGKAVHLSPQVTNAAVMELKTAPHDIPEQYRIGWRGMRNSIDTSPTNIILRDDAGREALRIRISDNRLEFISDQPESNPHFQFSTLSTHDVAITLEMSGAPAARIQVDEPDGRTYQTPRLGLVDSDFRKLEVIEVHSAGEYLIRDVVVVAQN